MARHLLLLVLVLLLAAPVLAKKPKPPPCDPGTFVLAGTNEQIEIELGGGVVFAPLCPLTGGKLKAGRKGTKVSAKWGKGVCEGFEKKVKLKAKFDESCDVLSGKVKSRKFKQEFTADRVLVLEGLGNPSLEPELESGASLGRVIGPAGGEATTWGADGTVYRLRVPAGALPEPTGITLTPVVSLEGMPLEGGFVAALDLQPAGLAFATPARLTITPPDPLPEGPLAGFGWTGSERAFGAAPGWVSPDGASFHVQVAHFSGYGMGIPGPSQLDALTAELLAQQNADLAFALPLEACLNGQVGCTGDQVEALLIGWFETIVVPRLSEAGGGTDPVVTIAAHEALLAWRAAATVHVSLDDVFIAFPALREPFEIWTAQDLLNLFTVFQAYTPPACSGTVTDWRDWIRVPQEIVARAQAAYEPARIESLEFGVLDACAQLALEEVSFPDTLGDGETELDLSLRTVVRVEGGSAVPVESEVDLLFGPGASGLDSHLTDGDGRLEIPVSRDPTAARVAVDIVARESDTGLADVARVVAGSTVFAFEDNLEGDPDIVPTGGTRELCVVSELGAPAGTVVQFEIEEPGTLAAPNATLGLRFDDSMAACVDYQAPDGPVGRNLAAVVTATMDFDGETWTDTVQVHPHWIDLALRVDAGSGYVSATNATVPVRGDGPYAIEVRAEEAGATIGSPPVPWVGQVSADASTATLSGPGPGCCATHVALTTGANGRATLQWRGNGTTDSEYPIQVTAGTGASQVGAGVTLLRANWNVSATFPSQVEPEVSRELVVRVVDDFGAPVANAWIQVDATGGSVTGGSGRTDADGELTARATLGAGETVLTLTIRLSQFAGGPVLDTATVTAVGPGAAPFLLTERSALTTARLLSFEFDDPGELTGLGSELTEVDITGSGNVEGERALASHTSNVAVTDTLLTVDFDGRGVGLGRGFVRENRLRVVVTIFRDDVPWRLTTSHQYTIEDEGNGGGEATVTFESEDGTSPLACAGVGSASPCSGVEGVANGTLAPGRYVFETTMDFQRATVDLDATLEIGELP